MFETVASTDSAIRAFVSMCVEDEVCGGRSKNLCPRPVNGVMTWTGTKVGIFFISGNRQIVFLGKKNPFPRLSVMVLQPLRPEDLRFRNQ